MKTRIFLLQMMAVCLIVSALKCPNPLNPANHCDGSLFTVRPLTVPSSPPSPPSTPLAHLGLLSGNIAQGVDSQSPAGLNFTLTGNETLDFTAKGSDPVSGIVTIQIRYSETKWITNANGTDSQEGPGSAAPAKENADVQTAKMKKAGDSVCEARNTALRLQAANLLAGHGLRFSKYKLEVWATTINAFGTSSDSKRITLTWP